MFNFDNTFEIHDDIEVLKRMGMAYGLESGNCSQENINTAKSLLPPVLKPYVDGKCAFHAYDWETVNFSGLKLSKSYTWGLHLVLYQ